MMAAAIIAAIVSFISSLDHLRTEAESFCFRLFFFAIGVFLLPGGIFFPPNNIIINDFLYFVNAFTRYFIYFIKKNIDNIKDIW